MRKMLFCVILLAYIVNVCSFSFAQRQEFSPVIALLSSDIPVLKGVRIDSRQPFRFEFFVNQGQREETQEVLKDETRRLVEYFLASLAVPEKDLWVNLSPYEKDRIIPAALGLTSMGKELLSQDYVLKQATAGLIHPDKGTGQVFWQKVYARARDMYGTTDIPFDFSNKVWIVPDRAVVYERFEEGKAVAYVVEARLKVMSESDYVAAQEYMDAADSQGREGRSKTQDLMQDILREVIVPELEREVNEGVAFSGLRQVYYSLILGAWYRNKMKESVFSRVYVDQKKTEGIDHKESRMAEKIWKQYVESFRQGVFNFIREEKDPDTQDIIPRKYISGGMNLVNPEVTITHELPQGVDQAQSMSAVVDISPLGGAAVDSAGVFLTKDQLIINIDGVKIDDRDVSVVFRPINENARKKLVSFTANTLEAAGYMSDDQGQFTVTWHDLSLKGTRGNKDIQKFVDYSVTQDLLNHYLSRIFERDHLYMIEDLVRKFGGRQEMSPQDFLRNLKSIDIQYLDRGAEKHVFLVKFLLDSAKEVELVMALRVGTAGTQALYRQNEILQVLWNTGLVPKVSKYDGKVGYMEYVFGEMLNDYLEDGRLTDRHIDETVKALTRLGHVMTDMEAQRHYLLVDAVRIDFLAIDSSLDPDNDAANYIALGLAEKDDRLNTDGIHFVRLTSKFWKEGKDILGEKNWKKVLRGLYAERFFDDTHGNNIIFKGEKAVVIDGLSDDRELSGAFLKYLFHMLNNYNKSPEIKRARQERIMYYFIKYMGIDNAWAAMFDILTGKEKADLKNDLKSVIGRYYDLEGVSVDAYLSLILMKGIHEEMFPVESVIEMTEEKSPLLSEAYKKLIYRFVDFDDVGISQSFDSLLEEAVRNDVLDTPELMEAAGQLRKAAEMMSRVVEFDENNTLVHPWQSFGLAFKAGIFDAGQGVSTDVMGKDVGGIDLHTIDKSLEHVQKEEGSLRLFNIDPALQEQYRSASGVSAVVLHVSPHVSVSDFLTFP